MISGSGLLLLLSPLVLYWVIRMAVRHGIEDAGKRSAYRLRSHGDGDQVPPPARGMSTAWYRLLGTFGWFG